MNIIKKNQDYFELLRKIHVKDSQSQRDLAKNLGFSLGKLNYCLRALKLKGLVKLKNYKNQNNKIKYLQYIITPKGISLRTKLTIDFMKRKMQEFEELKKELKKTKK